jgi:hypothetical protein
MSSQFRRTNPGDAPAVASFLTQVFSMNAGNPVIEPAHMNWKYWHDHPDWNGTRGFVMQRGEDIIAHGSVIPIPCLWQDRRLNIVNLIDWAARPDSPGAGISLLKRVAQLVDGVFVAGGSEMTQKILPALGFKESVNATQFARPLRPVKRLRAESNWSWRSGARFARNIAWMIKGTGSVHARDWSSRRLLAADVIGAKFPTPCPSVQASAVFERTGRAMAYFLDCPATPVEFHLVERSGSSITGYFVLTFPPGQCRIADAWVDSNRPEDWADLYQLAVQQGREHADAAEIVTVATTAVASGALQQTGFHERGRVVLRFLLRGGGDPPPDIRYQLMDGDGAFLHNGRPSFWA